MTGFLISTFIFTFFVLAIAAKIHGVVLSFKKKWYIGVLALVVPLFAEIVSVVKVVLDKDLLA